MNKNFFPTLGEALDAVRAYLVTSRCELKDAENAFSKFTFGGVPYGATVSEAMELSVFKGKPVTGRMATRALTLNVYRMESGTYEAVAYVS
jgi:hypothetical protein